MKMGRKQPQYAVRTPSVVYIGRKCCSRVRPIPIGCTHY